IYGFRLPNFATAAKCRAFGFCFFHFASAFVRITLPEIPCTSIRRPALNSRGNAHTDSVSRVWGEGGRRWMVCDSAAFGCLPEMSQVVLLDIKSRRDSPLCCRGETLAPCPPRCLGCSDGPEV